MALRIATANRVSEDAHSPKSVRALAVTLGVAFAVPTYAHALSQTFLPNVATLITGVSVIVFLPMIVWLAMTTIAKNGDVQRVLGLAALITVPLLMSVAAHVGAYGPMQLQAVLVRVAAITFYMLIAGFLIHHARRDELIPTAFLVLALLLALLFVFMAATRPVDHWGRLKPGDFNANWWGEVFQVIILAAAFARARWIFYGVLPFAFLGLLFVQSRGSLIAALILVTFAILAREGLRRLLVIGAAMILFGLPLLIAFDQLALGGRLLDGLIAFVVNDVLLLNHPGRGIGSGFTGRTGGYAVAWQQFVESPWIGVGFGLGHQLSHELAGGAVHNGHLVLLSELGLLFYPFVLVIMLGGMFRALRHRHWFVFGVLVAWYFYMMFAPRSLNLSVVPMTGIIFMTWAWLLPASATKPVTDVTTTPRLGRRWQGGAAVDQPRSARSEGLPTPV